MQAIQNIWTKSGGWKSVLEDKNADVVFLFGYGEYFATSCFDDVKKMYPNANIIGCSTSGNILNSSISDEAVVLSAVKFKNSSCKLVFEDFNSVDDSYNVGESLAKQLLDDGLKHIFVLSDGLNINGDKLSDGINSGTNHSISVSGGLAGDSTAFANTYIIANDSAKQKRVAAIGFYGDDLNITVGCHAGWDEFGPERVITKSTNNVVYEIDGKPALDLYKSYLGVEAANLPSSGLKFPIAILDKTEDSFIIRTLLAIDENEHSLIFAGNAPEGSTCRLMKANLDKLIENSELAANDAKPDESKNTLSIAVSCVGRRLVLGQLVEDELEIIKDCFGDDNLLTGYYSYGEIAPLFGKTECKLHNQTMTITTIDENA